MQFQILNDFTQAQAGKFCVFFISHLLLSKAYVLRNHIKNRSVSANPSSLGYGFRREFCLDTADNLKALRLSGVLDNLAFYAASY